MPKSIETAPKDGSRITVLWRDRDGVENSSVAQYRSGEPAEAGWWVFTDSDTQKRVQPHGWVAAGEDEED